MKLLLAAGARVDRVDGRGRTALELAVQSGQGGLLPALAAALGSQPSRGELDLATCAATAMGSPSDLEVLLELGASPDARCRDGHNLLTLAAAGGASPCITLLLAHGGKAEQASASGNTPLIHAANAGQLEAARLLLNAGADVNARGHKRDTPLMHAARTGRLEMLDLLLANGARPGLRNSDGRSARKLAESAGNAAVLAALDAHKQAKGKWLGLL